LPCGGGKAAVAHDGGQDGHAFELVEHEDFLNSPANQGRLISAL
jgi:hypothetical protein